MTETAPRPADRASRALSISGLDRVRGMRDGTLPGPPIGDTLGFRVTEAEAGRVVVEAVPGPAHANTTGQPHGGWYGAVLDTCMACAVLTMVPAGSGYTTLEYRVNVTRPVPLGMRVRAEGLVQHAGRSTGVARGEIRGAENGVLYATGSTTCLIMSAG
jgi:uncharacterized protein (TIGR00369 family)